MAKKPKLTESAKQKRVDVAAENINYDQNIWKNAFSSMNSVSKLNPKINSVSAALQTLVLTKKIYFRSKTRYGVPLCVLRAFHTLVSAPS